MLNKTNRINKTRDLKQVYRLGKAVHASALVIKFFAKKESQLLAKSRIAFVVSKKVSKRAVDRNRIKRVLREDVRSKLKDLLPGDYVIVVKPVAGTLQNPDLRRQLGYALNKGNLWKKS